MRRIILAWALCVTFAFNSFAQLRSECSMPETVQQKDCDMVSDPTSVCNTGGEAFSEFLERFCADQDFCESRLYDLDKEDGYEGSGLLTWVRNHQQDFTYFTPYYQKDQCEETLKTWYAVTADHALFGSSNVVSCNPDDPEDLYCTHSWMTVWTFERKDGKWYFTDILSIGEVI